MIFKIAYGAGHNLYTSGRRIPKTLDRNETKEWVLNDRVARYFAEAASGYEGVQLLRVDDPQGQGEVDLSARSIAANNWDADFCLAIHHNGGINLGTGGGIEAYSYPGSAKGAAYRDAIYDACIAAGGLKGNRASPKKEENFQVLRQTNAPAVLMEFGYMDSIADAPVILTEAYAKLVAYATMEGIAKIAGLKKTENKTENETDKKEETTVTVTLNMLGKGSKGNQVKALQRMLYAMGYDLGANPIDGDFGTKTDAAVRSYQTDQGLTADGIVGEKTWASLLGA
ncbi:MAG: N-acetylmuramoyl-L-alanine amidase [Oscillospiraceae bacterium]|nr:N-acetylmuramoyl-L-alanine amidase [Oscillospiraceae bacterium]